MIYVADSTIKEIDDMKIKDIIKQEENQVIIEDRVEINVFPEKIAEKDKEYIKWLKKKNEVAAKFRDLLDYFKCESDLEEINKFLENIMENGIGKLNHKENWKLALVASIIKGDW